MYLLEKINDKEILLSIGIFCLIISMILRYFSYEVYILDFFEGLFIGLSMVFNISYLWKLRNH